jgi:S-adenosylmethionine decarboxylase
MPDAAGATLLHIHLHRFTPKWTSALPCWPKATSASIPGPSAAMRRSDVFMCGIAEPRKALTVLEEAFAASAWSSLFTSGAFSKGRDAEPHLT